MADYPIIFSPPMVLALLDGRKTQTRRLAWRQIDTSFPDYDKHFVTKNGDVFAPTIWQKVRPGDRLWARETWGATKRYDHLPPREIPRSSAIGYTTDDIGIWCQTGCSGAAGKWRRSIHMPRWASRMTLVVTATRIEHVQDISEGDAIAEGPYPQMGDGGKSGTGFKWKGLGYHGGTRSKRWGPCFHASYDDGPTCGCNVGWKRPAQCAYREIWTRLHGQQNWDDNPEVVALTFEVHKANIDAMDQPPHRPERRE